MYVYSNSSGCVCVCVCVFVQCSWEELLHAVAGMCCVALPDMEETAVYSSLTRSGSKTIILLANTEKTRHQNCKEEITAGSVGSDGVLGSSGVSRTVEATTDCSDGGAVTQTSSGSTGNSIDNLERSFHEVFSESESSECERYITPMFHHSRVYSFQLSLG